MKTLAECGATFDVPIAEGVEDRYTAIRARNGTTTNYSLYLLNVTKHIKGACCCKIMNLLKQVKQDDKTYLKFLPDGVTNMETVAEFTVMTFSGLYKPLRTQHTKAKHMIINNISPSRL